MILLIDNYDSFTYNLYQQIERLGKEVKVVKNDQITVGEIEKLEPEKIIISPGPGRPEDSKTSILAVQKFYTKTPILGVCLGHQAIGQIFSSRVVAAKKIMHGKTSEIKHSGQNLFKNVPQNIKVARYHSLAIDQVPPDFQLEAWAADREIMAISHKKHPLYGIQFHPESFLTEHGDQIIQNFLNV